MKRRVPVKDLKPNVCIFNPFDDMLYVQDIHTHKYLVMDRHLQPVRMFYAVCSAGRPCFDDRFMIVVNTHCVKWINDQGLAHQTYTTRHATDGPVRVAIRGHFLYVADSDHDLVYVFDKLSLDMVTRLAIKNPIAFCHVEDKLVVVSLLYHSGRCMLFSI
jgi:hypothetical protein